MAKYISPLNFINEFDAFLKHDLPAINDVRPYLNSTASNNITFANNFTNVHDSKDDQLQYWKWNGSILLIRTSHSTENSYRYLTNSVDLRDIYINVPSQSYRKIKLLEIFDVKYNPSRNSEIQELVEIGSTFKVLPCFKNDPTFKPHYNVKSHELRRFDLQACNFLNIVQKIVLYCNNSCDIIEDNKKCPKCELAKKFIHSTFNLGGFNAIPEIFILEHDYEPTFLPLQNYKLNRNLIHREQIEMTQMTHATPVDNSIFVGNSYDLDGIHYSPTTDNYPYYNIEYSTIFEKMQLSEKNKSITIGESDIHWDITIECTVANQQEQNNSNILDSEFDETKSKLKFPGAGSFTLGGLNKTRIENILKYCQFLYISNMSNKKILVYCRDGYTESSFLIIAFLIFKYSLSLTRAILTLHDLNRQLFLYPGDIQVLGHIEPILHDNSPLNQKQQLIDINADNNLATKLNIEISSNNFTEIFLTKLPSNYARLMNIKGPLPSKILPFLYLGSLHNIIYPDILRSLNITHLINIGSLPPWLNRTNKNTNKQKYTTSIESYEQYNIKILCLHDLLDNGEMSITGYFDQLIEFINTCKRDSGRIIIQCDMGVSRSVTIILAYLIKQYKISLIKSYLYLRCRRLNIIIQPSILFMYELLKWEHLCLNENKTIDCKTKRSNDWFSLCMEISHLNKIYSA
ncbi:hypothetical protein TBLA_0F01370 [Henningerozyma blattae CBS 6284]|uniref:Uncharacterized protein n=1 Tax=Henningerozyma blattae (strain ATCC 34711 / CBS 6284 / DSM 70876 / NBRC 10599 / NRRL Y-10934 / UCD 77-7) TaxID=1071380 RepID=I2H5M8_HENB6|nr:hypothetical protein TBLA_0F01370 [Tetrapisispora blattae CBS 6284]CCH61680.1 hypothetical protein TBLA_0F01370 [Tetrapisispora blattae CBS 6284]